LSNPQIGAPSIVGSLRLRITYIYTATLHIGSCSSIRNPRMHHAAETGTLLIMDGSTKLKLILQSSKIDWTRAIQYKAQDLQFLLLET